MTLPATNYNSLPAKLIFNPQSGAVGESPAQLMRVITEMQALSLVPEVHLVEPESPLLAVVEEALDRNIRLFVVCGGDGTIASVAAGLMGTRATLGIIPTGTQNNLALSLGIPGDLSAAVALLRTGQRTLVDMGVAVCGDKEAPFLEVCLVGLLAALFPTADDIQHGNLARLGDFLAMLVSSPSAEMHLVLDHRQEIQTQGHVILVANMPYIGPHYQVASEGAHVDGLLDVLVFADISKLDLLGHAAAVQMSGSGGPEDPRIQHYRVRSLEIETTPPMPSAVDGFPLGEGLLHISVRRRALAVMTGGPVPVPVTAPALSDASVVVPGLPSSLGPPSNLGAEAIHEPQPA